MKGWGWPKSWPRPRDNPGQCGHPWGYSQLAGDLGEQIWFRSPRMQVHFRPEDLVETWSPQVSSDQPRCLGEERKRGLWKEAQVRQIFLRRVKLNLCFWNAQSQHSIVFRFNCHSLPPHPKQTLNQSICCEGTLKFVREWKDKSCMNFLK